MFLPLVLFMPPSPAPENMGSFAEVRSTADKCMKSSDVRGRQNQLIQRWLQYLSEEALFAYLLLELLNPAPELCIRSVLSAAGDISYSCTFHARFFHKRRCFLLK